LQAYFPKRFFRYKRKFLVEPLYLKSAEQLMKDRL